MHTRSESPIACRPAGLSCPAGYSRLLLPALIFQPHAAWFVCATLYQFTRYIRYNVHATSYTWKHLGRLLDMDRSLADNGLPDESADFFDLSIDRHEFVPEVQVYFNDDLTEF